MRSDFFYITVSWVKLWEFTPRITSSVWGRPEHVPVRRRRCRLLAGLVGVSKSSLISGAIKFNSSLQWDYINGPGVIKWKRSSPLGGMNVFNIHSETMIYSYLLNSQLTVVWEPCMSQKYKFRADGGDPRWAGVVKFHLGGSMNIKNNFHDATLMLRNM